MSEPELIVQVKYDYQATEQEELNITKGEKLILLDDSKPWWQVKKHSGEVGYVPSNFVEEVETSNFVKKDKTSFGSKLIGIIKPKKTKGSISDNRRAASQNHHARTATSDTTADGDITFELPIATGPFAVVVKNYAARQEDELSLRKGEKVIVQEKSSDGCRCWGEYRGLSGWFPSNYVIELEGASGNNKSNVSFKGKESAVVDDFIFRVVALYTFTGSNDEDLDFERDEQLYIIEVFDANWWKARNQHGEIGMVPSSYVEILEDDATPVVGKRTQSRAGSGARGGSGAEASGHQADHSAYEHDGDSIVEYHEYLGGGASGEVHRVTWTDIYHQSIEAAAKKVRITEDNSNKDILREADMLKKLNHVNVIKFFGLETTASHVIIVTEYASKGSLRGILRASERLSKRLFDKWMLEAALGIQYAHHQEIVHCDVKSENFVVSGEDILKLCDLGIARHLSQTTMTSKEAGTEFWQAPEVFKEQLRSPACDVYSYGVVVWELYTCDYPGKGFNVPGAFKWQVGTQNYRPAIPDDCPAAVRNLIERCWLENYKQRPHIDKVVRYIQEGHSSVKELR